MKNEVTVYEQPGKLLTENGILLLTSAFNQENIMPLVARIMEYNLLAEALRPEYITLIINSPGGSVHSAYHLIDVMKSSKIPVHTVGMGLIASCGVLTFMAGAKGHRRITKNTSVMSHTYSWGSGGKEHELYAIQKEFEMSSQRMLDHYRKCTGKTEKYIRKHLLSPQDEWLTPEECVAHGLCDEISDIY
jgi:ATP-dependent Clp protease protease subunit